MNFFHLKPQLARRSRKNKFASLKQMQAAFYREAEDLYWIALVITGEAELARQSVVNAPGLASASTVAFRDWLVKWAHSATVRVAAEAVHDRMITAAKQHRNWQCCHSDHEPLSDEDAAEVRNRAPLDLISRLDTLERSALVLHGEQEGSIRQCSRLLKIPRRSVLTAYCRALQSTGKREHAPTDRHQPALRDLSFAAGGSKL